MSHFTRWIKINQNILSSLFLTGFFGLQKILFWSFSSHQFDTSNYRCKYNREGAILGQVFFLFFWEFFFGGGQFFLMRISFLFYLQLFFRIFVYILNHSKQNYYIQEIYQSENCIHSFWWLKGRVGRAIVVVKINTKCFFFKISSNLITADFLKIISAFFFFRDKLPYNLITWFWFMSFVFLHQTVVMCVGVVNVVFNFCFIFQRKHFIFLEKNRPSNFYWRIDVLLVVNLLGFFSSIDFFKEYFFLRNLFLNFLNFFE